MKKCLLRYFHGIENEVMWSFSTLALLFFRNNCQMNSKNDFLCLILFKDFVTSFYMRVLNERAKT